MIHTYHPELTEPITSPLRHSTLPLSSTPEIHFINYFQPSTPLKHTFPTPPYSSDILTFLKKLKFQFSDLTESEYLQLCSNLVKNKKCYATHQNVVGLIKTPFRIRLKKCSTSN